MKSIAPLSRKLIFRSFSTAREIPNQISILGFSLDAFRHENLIKQSWNDVTNRFSQFHCQRHFSNRQHKAQCGEAQDIKILFTDRKFSVLERVYAAPWNLWQLLNLNFVKLVHEAETRVFKRTYAHLCWLILDRSCFHFETLLLF